MVLESRTLVVLNQSEKTCPNERKLLIEQLQGDGQQIVRLKFYNCIGFGFYWVVRFFKISEFVSCSFPEVQKNPTWPIE